MHVLENAKILLVIKLNVVNNYIFFFFYKYIMVKYYGRARQRTGAVNRIQPGLKMAGLRPKNGTLISSVRIQQNRVNGNIGVGCVDAQGNPTGKRRTFDKKLCVFCVNNTSTDGKPLYLLKAAAPASRQCAGGVNRHFPLGCR